MKKKLFAFLTALLLSASLTACAESREAPAALAGAPEALGEMELTDVAGHPAEADILEGVRRGLYSAPSDGLFRPDRPVTRMEFLLALWNLAGRPGAPEQNAPSAWSAELRQAFSWADAAGCLDSAAASGTFDPDELMTRQAAMESLFACNGSVQGMESMFYGFYDNAFTDCAKLPPESKRALYWGFYNVLIRETETDRLSPSGTVSRGDMANMMVRYGNVFQNGPPENQEKEESKQ